MRMALLIALCEPSHLADAMSSPTWQARSSVCKPLRPVPHARTRLLLASSAVPPGARPPTSQSKEPAPAAPAGRYVSAPMSRWLLVAMVFVPVLANALLSQAVPTALLEAYGNDRIRTARMLGRLSSCGALLDVLLTPQLGRLSDTIGRRPLLLIAPCTALTLRAAAACRPGIANLMALRVLGTTLTSTYLVCLRASLADAHRFEGTGKLTGRLGLMQASNGAAYALGMLLGGQLVARHIRLPYAASATLLSLLVPLVFVCFRETLTREQRVPFRLRPPGLGFVRLFSSGPELRGLSTVHALQTLSIAMGDTWQVFSRELRGWAASECGLFGSLSGAGAMVTLTLTVTIPTLTTDH